MLLCDKKEHSKCVIKDRVFRKIVEHAVKCSKGKGKDHAHNRPQGPKGVPGRLRPRIFLTFGTTRVVGRQPHAPAAYSFLEAESTPWFRR
jgi:hypothetical protein